VDDLQQSFDILDNKESQFNDINCLDKCKKINLSKLNLKLDLNKGMGINQQSNDNNDQLDRDKVTNISITLSPLQKDENNQSNFDLSQDYGRNEIINLNQNEKYDKNEDINTNTRKKQIDCKKLKRKYLIGG